MSLEAPMPVPGRNPKLRAGLVALVALVPPSAALAQPYAVAWHTVDAGGAMDGTGGTYGISGTLGQPDAGGPFAGGTYLVQGGFWALIAPGGAGVQADLAVTKSDGQASAIPGQGLTYTILVSNAGPADATGATIADSLPAVLQGATWTCSASTGSSCSPSGSGGINDMVNLLANGMLTYTLTGTVDPTAAGSLANTATVVAPAGVVDPNPGNNSDTDTDSLTPQADLSIAKSDSPDPVGSGGTLVYTLTITNLGPSVSSGMSVTDVLPADVSFQSSSPGAPACTQAAGTVSCSLGALLPSASHTVTIQTIVIPPALGPISNTASVAGNEPDPVPGSDSDTEPTQVIAAAEGELVHGTELQADLESVGGVPDQDLYRIRQRPHASYEVIVDATSGDIGTGQGPGLERLDSDATTVLQSSQPAGAGPSRSLRWANETAAAVDGEYVRVRSLSCTTSCDPQDVYRMRAYETTCSIARFNNSTSQVTVVLIQNTSPAPVAGRIAFWSVSGALLHEQPFAVGPRGLYSLNTSSVPVLSGQSGNVSVAHDAPYGTLSGKAVAVEPATGFTFDTPVLPRPLR
jgi:uncharacterized repeat protein (TIGR01451 family)